MKPKNLFAFGYRPKVIKMAPLVKSQKLHEQIRRRIWVTGQHVELLDQVLILFNFRTVDDLHELWRGQNYCVTSQDIYNQRIVFYYFQPDSLHCSPFSLLNLQLDTSRQELIITGHQSVSHGKGCLQIYTAFREYALTEEVSVAYPRHLNPNVQKVNCGLLFDLTGGYGSVAVKLLGSDQNKIIDHSRQLICDQGLINCYSDITCVYGDARASENRIHFLFAEAFTTPKRKETNQYKTNTTCL